MEERRLIRNGIHSIEHLDDHKNCKTKCNSLDFPNKEVVTSSFNFNSGKGVNRNISPFATFSPVC